LTPQLTSIPMTIPTHEDMINGQLAGSLVSNTFTIDQGILEKMLEFAPREWLLSSYIATGMENIPIFIKADNAEEEIAVNLRNHA